MTGFANAIKAGLTAARALKSEPVSYDDGNGPIALTAAVGSTAFRQTDLNGISTLQRTVDFLIDPLDLTRDGTPIIPDAGHTLTRTDTAETHEVIPLNGEPSWRWSDAGQTQLRIHTQKTGDA